MALQNDKMYAKFCTGCAAPALAATIAQNSLDLQKCMHFIYNFHSHSGYELNILYMNGVNHKTDLVIVQGTIKGQK